MEPTMFKVVAGIVVVLVVATAVILVLGGWMLTVLTQFATRLIGDIPNYL